MNEKMPYYMAYPMPFSYEDERTERMDLEYLRSMYPDLPKRILPYVEEECVGWSMRTVWFMISIRINFS